MSQHPSPVSGQDLTEFYRDRHPQLQNYLYWQVRSQEIAEELAQETYLRFLKQATPQPILDLNAFLFTIAANLARDHLRSNKRQQQREFIPLDTEIADVNLGPEDIVAHYCLESQLQQAIANLPEKTREIFLLYRVDELSYKQIAARLDISERTVEYHLRQALLLCRNFLTNFSRLPTETVDAVSRYSYQSPDEHQENTVAQSELHGHFLTGAVDHQMVAGFETSHSLFAYVADFSFYDTINLVNPVYGGAVPAETVGFGSQDMADTNAVYLQDQVKWGKWRLLAGWRHDEVETISKDPLSTFRSQQSEGADTARAGLLYTITPSTSVYYSFSQSFVPNLGRDINNGVFKADRGTQHEIGVKQSLLKGLDLTVSLFDIRRKNVVGPDADNPGFRVSNGEQSSQGLETSLTGDVTSDLHVISNFTWLDAKVESGDPEKVGDRLYGVPHFSANAWGLYDLPLAIPGKLSTGFGIVHVGDREATLPNYGLKLPEYTRYDLGIFYKLKNMRVALNLRNLTDEKYYETLENFAVQAQAPLNWALRVGYDFQ